MDICRICYEPDALVNVCGCQGTAGYVHIKCIEEWIQHSHRRTCEICHQPYEHTQLVTYDMMMIWRIRQASFITFLLGMIHGIAVWADSMLEVRFFWIYVFTCGIFNAVQMGVVHLFDLLRDRYWPVHFWFVAGFVLGNAPGQLSIMKMNIEVIHCYMMNIFFLVIFCVYEKRIHT